MKWKEAIVFEAMCYALIFKKVRQVQTEFGTCVRLRIYVLSCARLDAEGQEGVSLRPVGMTKVLNTG